MRNGYGQPLAHPSSPPSNAQPVSLTRTKSGRMRERLLHGFRTYRQMSNASARGGKDRIPDRGRDRGCRRLAESNRRFRAREKFDFEFGYVAHAQQPIGV